MREIANARSRRASIKETGEELSQEDWRRFDMAVAQVKAERDFVARGGASFRLPERPKPRVAERP